LNRRALVIGSQIAGLQGVEHDVARMKEALAGRGFAVDLRIGGDATRAGILDGYAALIRDAAPGDAAVVYYSGHGGYVVNPDPRAGSPEHPEVPQAMQLIVPTDAPQSTDEDFRGITSWELSLHLADLTRVTRNVTVIFDCCHAAQMSRGAAAREAVPRALPHPIRLGIDRYLSALRDQGARFDLLAPEGNPDAVRVFAAGETQSAWEYVGASGERTGVLTESLLGFLEEIGDGAVTWESLGRAIRERVLRLFPGQRAEIAGPIGREPFSLREPARASSVPLGQRDGRTILRAGRLAGVSEGDVYAVMPLDAPEYDGRTCLARATVTDVGALDATVTIADRLAPGPLPDGAVAFPLELQLPRHPVRIAGSGTLAASLAAAVAASPRLRVAAAGEAATDDAIVRADSERLTLADGLGELFPAVMVRNNDERPTVTAMVGLLTDLAVAASIRSLEGEHGLDGACANVTWGVVIDGAPRPQPPHGTVLGLRDRIYLRVENGSQQRVYVHIFNIGVRGKVTLLTGAAPSGVRLEGGATYTLGAVDGRGLVGQPLGWPAGLAPDLARRDELLVIATTQPVDLGVLETKQRVPPDTVERNGAPLRLLLAQMQSGGTRDVGGLGGDVDGYVAVSRSFLLAPVEARLTGGDGFLIDDNPTASHAVQAHAAWGAPTARASDVAALTGARPEAGRIAIRLDELIVHANRALGSADVRVDVLVTTRAAAGGAPYAVQTLRFPGIRDGDRLPLDRALLFHGDVRDFVDLCVWVSRDRGQDQTLVELLAEKARSPELQQAAGALLIAAGAAAGPWIGAVAASAVLTRIVYEVLAGTTGKSIGLYRTSFLAYEGFGAGRFPADGLCRAQDFSFALSVESIS